MGKDTIQLETAVSTISQEYLLEFTSEYGISEDVHPEFPGPDDRIVDFSEANSLVIIICNRRGQRWMSFSKRPGKNTPQCYTKPLDSLKNWNNIFFWLNERVYPIVVDWRTHAPKDEMPAANTYSSAPNLSKVKTGLRPRAAHEVSLLTATASLVIDMEDPDATTESSGTSSAIEKSPLDFDNENPATPMTEGKGPEDQAQETVAPKIPLPENMPAAGAVSKVREEEVAAMEPRSSKKRGRRGNDGADANAPPKVLRKDYAFVRPEQITCGGKSIPTMGLAAHMPLVCEGLHVLLKVEIKLGL
nr:hypothetical protein [Tanacetum cinerariifolium]